MTLYLRHDLESIPSYVMQRAWFGALEQLAAVRKVHAPKGGEGDDLYCAECVGDPENGYAEPWPCRTMRAIHNPDEIEDYCMSAVGNYSGSAPEMCALPAGHPGRCKP
jgi:hypothetical protein